MMVETERHMVAVDGAALADLMDLALTAARRLDWEDAPLSNALIGATATIRGSVERLFW